MQTFAERLKTLRKVFSVSQVELALAIGAQQYNITRFEQGIYKPSDEIKLKIANYFNVSPSWLIHGIPPIFSGIVFIPYRFTFKRKNSYSILCQIVDFIKKDKAEYFSEVYRCKEKRTGHSLYDAQHNEGFLVFRRPKDLLLFLLYSSSVEDLTGFEIAECISAYYGEEERKGVRHHKTLTYVISDTDFALLNSSSSIDIIEKTLKIKIPQELKGKYRPTKIEIDIETLRLLKLIGCEKDEFYSNEELKNYLGGCLSTIDDERLLKSILLRSNISKLFRLDPDYILALSLSDLKRSLGGKEIKTINEREKRIREKDILEKTGSDPDEHHLSSAWTNYGARLSHTGRNKIVKK